MEPLRQLKTELGKTLFMVTHDPATAEFADHTLFLEKGQLSNSPTREEELHAAASNSGGQKAEKREG
jgi:ABC-type lipoprotein export system ATPase subunit